MVINLNNRTGCSRAGDKSEWMVAHMQESPIRNTDNNDKLQSHLKTVSYLLEEGKWALATQLLEDISAEYEAFSKLHLYKLLAAYKLPREQALCTCPDEFEKSALWGKVCQYATGDEKQKYLDYAIAAQKFRSETTPKASDHLPQKKVPDGRLFHYSSIVDFAIILLGFWVVFNPGLIGLVCRSYLVKYKWLYWITRIGLSCVVLYPLSLVFKLVSIVLNRVFYKLNVQVLPGNQISCTWKRYFGSRFAVAIDHEWILSTDQTTAVASLPDDHKKHRLTVAAFSDSMNEEPVSHVSVCIKNRRASPSASPLQYVLALLLFCLYLTCSLYTLPRVHQPLSVLHLKAEPTTPSSTSLYWDQVKPIPGLPNDVTLQYTVMRKLPSDHEWLPLGTTDDTYFRDGPHHDSQFQRRQTEYEYKLEINIITEKKTSILETETVSAP